MIIIGGSGEGKWRLEKNYISLRSPRHADFSGAANEERAFFVSMVTFC